MAVLCPSCRREVRAWLDVRILLMRDAADRHAGAPGAEHAVETAETYLDAYQEMRRHLVGRRLPSGDR